MRIGRLPVVLLATLLAATAFVAAPAAAHDHKPPRLLLEHDGQRQRGINYHGWWTARRGDACIGWDAVGPRAFPDTPVREPDPWAAIRLVKRQEPRKVVLKAWPLVGPDDQPVGSATLVDVSIRRVRGAPTRQWGVVFEAPFAGDNYLELFVEWKDRERCGGEQGGYWGFHLFNESL